MAVGVAALIKSGSLGSDGARSPPLLPSAVADACSLHAQLSDGNVPLESRRNTIEKGLLDLEQWAGLGEWERSAGRKERCRISLPTRVGSKYSPDLDLACWRHPPPSRDAPAGRLYRPGGGASEATWTRPRPFRKINGPNSYRIGRRFESLEYLPSKSRRLFWLVLTGSRLQVQHRRLFFTCLPGLRED